MDILESAKPAVVFQYDETISKVVAALLKEKKHEALVFEGDEFKGVLTASDLVERNINDPERTKISHIKSIVQKTRIFAPETEPQELINSILTNSYRSVPILSNGKYYTINKLSLLGLLGKEVLHGKKAADVMVFPYALSPTDTLDVAQSVFRDLHIARLVIVNDQGTVDGIVDSLDVLRAIVNRQRPKRGELVGERIPMKNILASSPVFVKVNVPMVEEKTPLSDVVKKMISLNSPTVIVQDTKLRGIITPTSILKLSSRQVAGVYVNISGQQKEDPFIKSVVDDQIKNEVQKLAKIFPIEYIALHISRYNEAGKRVKYSVKGRLITEKGLFFAQDYAWDLTKAMRGVLEKFEREALKKREKNLQRR